MKNVGLNAIILFTLFSLFSCKNDYLPIDSPDGDFIKTGNLLINSNSAQLAARITYKNEIVPIVDRENSSLLKSTKGFPKIDLTKNYAFKLKAEVDPRFTRTIRCRQPMSPSKIIMLLLPIIPAVQNGWVV